MSDERKTETQKRLIARVAPDVAAKMEAESRTWMIRCPYCGYERSVWEMGGVRYKASGTSRQLRRCPQCGRLSWHILYRRKDPPGAGPALPPLASASRRPLLWALGLGGLVVLVAGFVGGLLLLLGALTQPVVSSGDAFMTALATADYAGADALCTPALQGQVGSVAGLATLVQGHQPGHWNWTSRSVRNGTGLLDGDLTYADGTAGTVHLTLQQVDSAWKISSFRMNPR